MPPGAGGDETTTAAEPDVTGAGSIAGGGEATAGAGGGIGVTGGGVGAGGAVAACDSFSIRSLESLAYCVLGYSLMMLL